MLSRLDTPSPWGGELHFKECSLREIEKEIETWVDGNDDTEGYFDKNRFFDYIKERFTIQKDGFYGWNGLKYVLYEYDYNLWEKSRNSEIKIDWVDFNKEKSDHISIEHIYPQASDQKCWNEFFGNHTVKEKFKLCNSLGNLLPLSQKKNSSLQNDCFSQKKQQKRGSVGYFNGSYSENEVAQKENWTPKEILNRGLKILLFIEKRWGIDFGNNEEKKELLNIEFLKE